MKSLIKIIVLLTLSWIYSSCALQRAPEGGPRDTAPPKIIRTFPDSFSTNFSGNELRFDFDEFIELSNPRLNVIISPLPDTQPSFTVKKKTLYIKFNGGLKKNSTYKIAFGNSIQDINERNILSNYTFVFSTGPTVDSLKIRGNATDILTGKLLKGYKAAVYEPGCDSCILFKKPLFYTITDENGQFEIQNINKDSFKVYLISDENNNFHFDEGESIGFVNGCIKSESDPEIIGFNVFKPKMEKVFLVKKGLESPGKLTLVFNTRIDSLQVYSERQENLIYGSASSGKDSFVYWIKNPEFSNKLLLTYKSRTVDTIDINLTKKTQSGLKIKVEKVISDYEQIKIITSEPCENIMTDKIIITDDSSRKVDQFTIKSLQNSKTDYELFLGFKPGRNYKICFADSAIQSIYGNYNDSVCFGVKFLNEDEFGSIAFEKTENVPGNHLIIQLVDNKNCVIREKSVSGSEGFKFEKLLPGKYKIRILADENNNGFWDTGNLRENRQPEKVLFYQEEINLKANWEITEPLLQIN